MSKKNRRKKYHIDYKNNVSVSEVSDIFEEKNIIDNTIVKKKRNKRIVFIIIALLFFSLLILFLFRKNIIYPEFQLIGSKDITLNYGETYEEEGYFVKIFDKDVSKNVVVKDNIDYNTIGEYEIEYDLRINYLNIDRVLKRKIKIVDKEKPSINVDSDDEVYLYQYEDYYIPNYIAVDNYDGDITSKVTIENPVNTSEIGEYTVIFSVSDSSGNSSSKEIKVIIEERRKGNGYVIISLSNQTLDYYEGGRVVLHSDVVTGKNGDTPVGTFSVVGKATNTTLKGDDYEVNVSYWIGFVGNSIGMHDASWRDSFGGNIYTYDPSHGCVNMPYYKVQELYFMIDYGTPVYVEY